MCLLFFFVYEKKKDTKILPLKQQQHTFLIIETVAVNCLYTFEKKCGIYKILIKKMPHDKKAKKKIPSNSRVSCFIATTFNKTKITNTAKTL